MTATERPRPTRYGGVAIAIHWISAVLIIILLLQGLFMTKLEDDAFKTNIYRLHVTLGYLVLILTVIRLAWARRDARPADPPMSTTERSLYKGVHVLLYAGAIITAVSGILLLVGSGIFPVATEVSASDIDRSLVFRTAHWLFALGMLVLLLAHVGGVLMYERSAGGVLARMGLGRDRARE